MIECVIVGPDLTGVCLVDFRNATSMHLSWPIPDKSVPLTYRVSYPNVALNSGSSSVPNISFDVSEFQKPYVVRDLLAGATYRFWVFAFPSGSIKSTEESPGTQLATEEITCVDTTGMVFLSICFHW